MGIHFFKQKLLKFFTLLLLCLAPSLGRSQSAVALDFDGVNDYVDLGTSTYLFGSSGNSVTVEGWYYMSSWVNGRTLIQNTSSGTITVYGGYEISTASGNLNAYTHRNGSYCTVSTPLAGISSGWHHVALTFDGRFTKLYVDAVLKSTNDAGGVYQMYASSGYPTLLGKSGGLSAGGGSGGYFQGKMDQIRIWYSCRTACQISNYMYKEGNPNEPGINYWDLVENYNFNSGNANANNSSYTSLVNASPYGAPSGTLFNFALSGTSSNWVAPGAPISGTNSALTHSQNTIPCYGGSVNITVGGALSYTWNTGYVGPTLTIPSYTSVGCYCHTVTATLAGGCQFGESFALSYHAPYLGITPSSTLICSGETVTLSAYGAVTYTWSNGSNSSSLTPAPNSSITRTVTGTDAFGCSGGPWSSAVVTVSVDPTPTIVIVPSSTVSCSTDNVTLTAIGASTYTWSNGSTTITTSNPWISSPNSTITRTVTGEINGCFDTAVQTISVNASPVLTITPSSTVICSGQTLTLTASGANTYTWTGGPSTAAYSPAPLTTTIYTVTGRTSASGCTDTAVQSVSVIASPTIIIAPSSTVICSTNVVTLTASGALTYTWSNGLGNNATVSLGPSTTFTRTVNGTAANGCTDTAIQTISVNPTPTVTIAFSSSVICSGQTTTLTGGGANTYTWSGGPTTAAYATSPITTTSYTVTGKTTASGCTDTAVQSVSVNASPTIGISSTSTVVCSGQTSTLTAGGANTYTWSGGPATAAYAVSPGTTTNYTVTGTTSASGCTDTAVQSVSVNVNPTVTIAATNTTICSGQTATLTAGGANTYTWTGGPSTAAYAISPLSTTIYTVTGRTTASGCTDTAVQQLSVNATPTVSISSSATTICAGITTTLTAGGATTYTWSGGPATAAYAVSPGATTNYTVTGTTSASGCTDTAVQSVSVNINPTVTITATNTTICSGQTATLTAGGANTYTWSGGPTTAAYSVNPVSTSVYTVTGRTSASGCTDVAVQSISVNASPTITIGNTGTVICSGKNTTLTANGGNTYVWAAGPSTSVNVVSPSSTTIYTVTGTTSTSGCTNTAVQSVSVNASPTITILASSTVICSGQTSTLTANNAGTYSWTAGPTTAANSVSPLTTTIYTVTGTSAIGGCTNSAMQSVSVNITPTITISAPSTVICSGQSATLTANNAGTYTWTSGPTTALNIVSPVATTVYTVTGSGAVGACTNFAVQTVSVNATPTISIGSTGTVICSGKNTTLTANGGNTYIWTAGPGTSVNVVSPTSTTVYTVTGTSSGCTNIAVQSVSVNASPTITILATSTVICSGQTSTLIANNASTYTWTAGPSTAVNSVSPLTTTIYTVTGATGGCTNSAVQSVSVNTTPTITISAPSTVICSGQAATLTANNAGTYTWTSGPATAQNIVSPVVTTVYTVTGSGAVGACTNFAVQTVSVNATPTISIGSTGTVICSGKNTTLTANGGNTYIWTAGPGTSVNVVSPSSTTVYTVTGTSSGCTNMAVQSVSVNASPTITILATSTVICSGQTSTLTASNAGTYTWTAGPTTAVNSVSPLTTTIYTVIGTNAIGSCTNSAVQSVSVNITPTLIVSASSTLICPGQTSTLTASNAGTYTWTSGPSTSTSVVNPLVTTIYTVTGTSATGSCTNTAVQTVSVNAAPSLSISCSATTICSGNSSTLIASGANSYVWSTGPTSSLIVVSPASITIYTVTGTNSTSGCTTTAVQSISVNPTPTVSISASNSVICASKTATLIGTGAGTYTWNTSAASSSIVVNPLATTNYSIIGTMALTGCTNSASQSMVVNPLPTLSVNGSTYVCSASPVVLAVSGANTYTWFNGSNSTTVLVTPTITSSFSVSGTNSFNCSNSASFQVLTTPVITPSICLVTVDSLSQYNEIYWEKTSYPQADTFIVLRETSASLYSVIARISKNAFSSYADTNRSLGLFNGNPNYSSYKYKLQFIDTCGNLSPASLYHQSIFIQDQKTGNFTWNYYYIEGSGPLAVNYILYRQNVITGSTTIVNGTSGTAMTDPLYASLAAAGNVKWYVGTTGFNCTPTQLSGSDKAAGKVNGTKSNSTNERQYPTAIRTVAPSAEIVSLFPNPVRENLTIAFSSSNVHAMLEIRDITGRSLLKEEINEQQHEIGATHLANGVYFITVYDHASRLLNEKIIVEHQ